MAFRVLSSCDAQKGPSLMVRSLAGLIKQRHIIPESGGSGWLLQVPAGLLHPRRPGGSQGGSQGPAGNLAGAGAPPGLGYKLRHAGEATAGWLPLCAHTPSSPFFHVERTKTDLSEPLSQWGWLWAFVGPS